MRKWIEIERGKYQKSLEREEITDDENGYNDAKAEDEATIAEKDAEIAKLKSIIAQHNQ